MVKCPKCNGTNFSVSIVAYQYYDGENDEWGGVEHIVGEQGEKPYFCVNCGKEFNLNELTGENELYDL